MKEIITHSEEETKKVARQIAKNIENNAVIVLNGELGAGKQNLLKVFYHILICKTKYQALLLQ